MSKMIERVAKAMEDRAARNPCTLEDVARAAIEAMREPTEAMLQAGPPEPYMDRDVWAKMIDAALEGK